MNTPKIDTFGTIEKNAVTEVGAPSYTSGAQKWNGAALSLKRNPNKINKKAIWTKIQSLVW